MTVRWVVALVLLLVSVSARADAVPVETRHALSLQNAVIHLAVQDLNVREKTNHNDHPRIDEVLTYMGLPLHLPYCASFLVWWYNHAGYGKVLPKIGGVMELKRRLASDELHYKIIKPADVALGIVPLQQGDIPIWNHGGGKGHTGVTVQPLSLKSFETIEANTQPGDQGNQREGGGVYRRTRKISVGSPGSVESFVRVR